MRVSEFNNIVSGKDGDLARNNLYSIEVYMPRGHGGEFGNFYTRGDLPGINYKLSYMAKAVTVPAKKLGTINNAKRFGPIYKVANDLMMESVSMTFMCSADFKEHLFFDGWISGIMGQIKNPEDRQVYTLSYYNDYIGLVNIIPLDRQGGAAAQITLKEAYPTGVGPIEFKWGAEGDVATFTVDWAFYDWNHTQTAGWSADPDLRDPLGPYGFTSQESREASKGGIYPGVPGESKDGFREASKGGIYPSTFRADRVGLTGESKDGFRESPAEIRKAKLKMGSGLDGLNTPIGRSKDGFREAPGNRNNKYPGVPGESEDGFRESAAVIKKAKSEAESERIKMGSGLDDLNVERKYREAPGNRNDKYPGVPGESKDGFRESAAVIKAGENKMGSGLDDLNAPIGRSTKGFREAPDNRNDKYPGVPGESTKGFRRSPADIRKMDSGLDFLNGAEKFGRKAPVKWVNPDTRGNKYPGVIPSHKTRPAPGHDGSLVKGLKDLLNILIR